MVTGLRIALAKHRELGRKQRAKPFVNNRLQRLTTVLQTLTTVLQTACNCIVGKSKFLLKEILNMFKISLRQEFTVYNKENCLQIFLATFYNIRTNVWRNPKFATPLQAFAAQ